jgi:cytochrome c oxidase assembly protein subunit 15
MNVPAYDLGPLASVVLIGAMVALVPLIWVIWRHRHSEPAARRRALTLLTLFLTFDLVLFGAFTRLSDSGLGCPDWPGCYGSASPLGARESIGAAQSAMPTGPVTHGKAWIEMLHRYLATGVGALITVLAITAWLEARRQRSRATAAVSPWWPTVTWLWVCGQGAFGALTVTMKLYPAIVTLHLLGGLGLLALLAIQSQLPLRSTLVLSPALRRGVVAVLGLVVVQTALGGWVSTNYAVLACAEFPTCQGSWWPPMDFDHGFTVLRELGAGKDGGYLPFAALTAIHMVHRIGAAILVLAIGVLIWRFWATGVAPLRRWAMALAGAIAWQVASGLGNVLFDWPLLAAVSHTGGAAALLVLFSMLLTRSWPERSPIPASVSPGRRGMRAAS